LNSAYRFRLGKDRGPVSPCSCTISFLPFPGYSRVFHLLRLLTFLPFPVLRGPSCSTTHFFCLKIPPFCFSNAVPWFPVLDRFSSSNSHRVHRNRLFPNLFYFRFGIPLLGLLGFFFLKQTRTAQALSDSRDPRTPCTFPAVEVSLPRCLVFACSAFFSVPLFDFSLNDFPGFTLSQLKSAPLAPHS